MSWNPWQRSKAGVDTSPNKQNDEEPQQVDLSHQLTRFLNTNEGLQVSSVVQVAKFMKHSGCAEMCSLSTET